MHHHIMHHHASSCIIMHHHASRLGLYGRASGENIETPQVSKQGLVLFQNSHLLLHFLKAPGTAKFWLLKNDEIIWIKQPFQVWYIWIIWIQEELQYLIISGIIKHSFLIPNLPEHNSTWSCKYNTAFSVGGVRNLFCPFLFPPPASSFLASCIACFFRRASRLGGTFKVTFMQWVR